jgi:hypothetical protein
VEDHNVDNNVSSASDVVAVFEEVDLKAKITDLRCSEREANQTSSACVATIDVTNNGPATNVQTETDVTIVPGPSCEATPSAATWALTLDSGQTATVTARAEISCTTQERHAVAVQAVLHNAASDPHAVDSDSASATWVPSDTKPRSLPSSINFGKQGLIPFAILATEGFNPLADLDFATLRYGVTGTEESIDRCDPSGEDVNDDNRLDLVCQAPARETGVALSTTAMVITGVRSDGTPFFSQDDVKVVGH